jgi:type IX secretion system PorP/SprF family membrane protein
MKSRKGVLNLFIVYLTATHLVAQDIHFSNPDQQPLYLNPGLAGVDATVQANVNFRKQWSSLPVPFTTSTVSVEGRFNEGARGKGGIIAGGLFLSNDKAGALNVVTNTAQMNLAYHLIINRYTSIGIGLNVGFGQRSIDATSGRWGSQYDGTAYNASLAGGDLPSSASFSYVDIGSGAALHYHPNNQFDLKAGLAVFHLNRPGFSFVNNDSADLSPRYSIFTTTDMAVSGTRGSFQPAFYLQLQNKAFELTYGVSYQYLLASGSKFTGRKRPASMSIGLFNRFKDALICRTQFEKDMYTLGFSYDVNISDLISASNGRGGFEIFLRFRFDSGRVKRR